MASTLVSASLLSGLIATSAVASERSIDLPCNELCQWWMDRPPVARTGPPDAQHQTPVQGADTSGVTWPIARQSDATRRRLQHPGARAVQSKSIRYVIVVRRLSSSPPARSDNLGVPKRAVTPIGGFPSGIPQENAAGWSQPAPAAESSNWERAALRIFEGSDGVASP